MKKIIMAILFAVSVIPLSARVTKIRQNGGLFGYKYVNQSGGNNPALACSYPGFHRCRFTPSDLVLPGDLTPENLVAIDELVLNSISEISTNGTVIYRDYTVKYLYNLEQNEITYKIFTQSEVDSGLADD